MAIKISELKDQRSFDNVGRPGLQYGEIRGVRVVLEWCVRRIITRRDALPWALGTCLSLEDEARNASATTSFQATMKRALDAQISAVEYVASVRSTIEVNEDVLQYKPQVRLTDGATYELGISISKAGPVLARFPL